MTASKRRISNVRLTRKFHFHHMGLWILISNALVILANLMLYLLVRQQWGYMGLFEDEGGGAANTISTFFSLLLVVETVCFCAALVWMGRFTSHRIAGAFLALQNTCDRVSAGDREVRQKFRSYDHLEELEQAFNRMLDTLHRTPPRG